MSFVKLHYGWKHTIRELSNFLDHHIKYLAIAIVGLAHRGELKGIADEAFKTLAVDDKGIAKTWRDKTEKNAEKKVLPK